MAGGVGMWGRLRLSVHHAGVEHLVEAEPAADVIARCGAQLVLAHRANLVRIAEGRRSMEAQRVTHRLELL